MASYELAFKASVAELQALPKQGVKQILQRIRALADDPRPRGYEKLSGLDVIASAKVFIESSTRSKTADSL